MFNMGLFHYLSSNIVWLYRLVDFVVPFLILFLIFLLSDISFSYDIVFNGFLSGVLYLFVNFLFSAYELYFWKSIAERLNLIFKAFVINFFFFMVIFYVFQKQDLNSGNVVFLWLIATPIFLYIFKSTVSRVFMNSSVSKLKVVFLGRHYSLNELEILRLESSNLEPIHLNMIELDALKSNILALQPDYLIINLDMPTSSEVIKDLTKLELNGVKLLSLPNFMEIFLRKCFIPYESMDLSYLSRIRSFSRKDLLLKRFTDLLCAFSLGLLTSPVMLWAAIKIRKESPGPIIFSQARVARGGYEKIIYKFRSMHVDAEKHGAQFASKDDPRAYEFGAFMRKTRIDELPQLWNVIKGDLHFVGPRPERKVFTDQLEEEIPYYNERHLVSPGITGWAQVLYPYGANTEDARQKLMYDLYYIKHWSIWLEIETLIRTVGVIIGKKGW